MTISRPSIAFLLALVLLSGSNAQTNPYCSISTCNPPSSNTLCKYSNTTIGAACAPFYPAASVVSAEDIQTILTTHNEFRRKVATGNEERGNPGPQPPASNMRELVWDEELANMAQTHAQQCLFQNDQCRDVSRFQVGQNVYVSISTAEETTPNWSATITYWYDEVTAMEPSFVSSFPENPPNTIGVYTQVVWATTTTVGCGVASYKDTVNFAPQYPYKMLYVCNYGESGNWLGDPVYEQGPAGSACPVGTTDSNGLCA